MQQNDKDKTINLLEDMVQRFPDRRESLFMLVDMYTRAGENKKTISTLDKIETLLGTQQCCYIYHCFHTKNIASLNLVALTSIIS